MSSAKGTTTNTNCKTFWPAAVCSGHGICDESTGKCLCNEGWSSFGDFALEEGVDCNINLTTVTALWSVDLIVYIILLIAVIGFYHIRCFKSKAPVKLSDPAFQYLVFFSIMVVAQIVLAILRISSPDKRVIGGDPATTVAFTISSTFSLCISIIFIYINSRFLLSIAKTMPIKSRDKAIMHVNAFNKGLPIGYALSVTAGVMPLFGLRYPQYAFWFCFGYHVTIAVGVNGYLIYGAITIFHPVITQIKSHIDDCKAADPTHNIKVFTELYMKLEVVDQARFSSKFTTILYLIIGCWPYLSRNTSYIFAVLHLLGSLLIIHLWALTNPKKDESTADNSNNNSSKGNQVNRGKFREVYEPHVASPAAPTSNMAKFPTGLSSNITKIVSTSSFQL